MDKQTSAEPWNGLGADKLLHATQSPSPETPVSKLRMLGFPVLLMNLPLSLSTEVPNNAYMEDLHPRQRKVCRDSAIQQFMSLYGHVARRALVYVLPSTPGLQDQPYVSNLGVVLPHCEADTVILSRFRSAPRVGEEEMGAAFFKLMNFRIVRPPEEFRGKPVYFEGEADFKHIYSDLYVGAYGLRTSRAALDWASQEFDMEIIPFHVTDPYLYHLDCSLLCLSEHAIMLCTEVTTGTCLEAIERRCDIVDVSLEHVRAGITNSLLLPGEILCDSPIAQLTKQSPSYSVEKSKIEYLERLCLQFGRELHVFCMSEFYKSGAMLSCLIMHINQIYDRTQYDIQKRVGVDHSRDAKQLSVEDALR